MRPTVLIGGVAPLQLAGTESYARIKPGANGPVDRIYSSQPNTLLWVGRTQKPQLFSRLPAFQTFSRRWICAEGSDSSFLVVTRYFSFSSDGEAG